MHRYRSGKIKGFSWIYSLLGKLQGLFFNHNTNIMKKVLYFSLVLTIIIPFYSSGQNEPQPVINSILKGRVADSVSRLPLAKVSIQIKGITNGTTSDNRGAFILYTAQRFPFTVVITSVGYESKEVIATGSPIDVLLKPVSGQLEDVVVVGYGRQQRRDLVGSVSSVNPEKIKNIPEASFDTQIQGLVPGVQINGGTGIPGSNTFIRVRGSTSINSSNDPLYIIDGVFVNNTSLQSISADRTTSPMADINPNDIEKIEILKDATAISIYGSRGANGVVIITTKRGKFEQEPRVNLDVSHGWGWSPKKWKLTTGPQHAEIVEEYRANEGLAPVFTATGRGLPEDQPTYDRQSILNQTAQYQNYNLSLVGGNGKTSYYLGANYANQEGIWKTMGFQRAGFKINIDQKINDKLKIGTSNVLSRSTRNIGRAVGSGGTGALYQATVDIPTYLPIFDEKGTPLRWVNFDNIYSLVNNTDNTSVSNHYIGVVYGEYDISPSLKLRSSFSLDYNTYDENEYWNTNVLRGIANNGEATSAFTQSDFWVNEQTLRYTRTFKGIHRLGVLVGTNIQGNIFKNTTARGTNFPNNSYTLISAAANQTVSQSWSKNHLVSVFSRLEYSFNDKYLLEGTLRADGSSKFAPQNRWGYFPAIGGAWRISEERFLKDNEVVNNLKLRVSYGVAGNQSGISDFAYRGLWTAGQGYPDVGTTESPGTKPFQLANLNLRWEKTAQFNIGSDIGLFKNRIRIEANYYSKYTTDALLEIVVPGYTGFTSYLSNYGEISNKGFELGISTENIRSNHFQWSTFFNIAQNKNKIEILSTPMSFEDRQFIRIEQGTSLYSFWLYNSLGVDPQTGDMILEDVNKDGEITPADRKIIGSAWPKFFGGLSNNLSFKNFDLNILFTYSYGNKVWNHNRMLGEQGGRLDANRVIYASQLNRWQKPGDITDVPRLALENYSRQEVSRFLEDGSFIRLRSLSLGYQLPQDILNRINITRARLFVTGSNLLLLTRYKGLDPETRIERGESQNIQGYDFASPPTPRSVQVGLNITF